MAGDHFLDQEIHDEPGEEPPRRGKNGSAALATPRRGLGTRFLDWLAPRRRSGPAGRASRLDESRGPRPQPSQQSKSELQGITSRLIAQDRYAFVLLKEAVGQITDEDARSAWQSLNSQMALIPAGTVPLIHSDGSLVSVDLAGFYLDRCAVTNRQYQRFVQAGGYDDLEIWPQEVWPSVARFTDRTGRPGPRDWENGKHVAALAEHPVVGVCWYEAVAYARWVGKRLPSAAEWQKAGGWPDQLSGGTCNRYPWGNMFEPARTNLSAAGVGQTVPVRAYPTGATPNGIYQMTGNVWEWLDDPLQTVACLPGEFFQPWKPMRRIVGGAFNTYFPSEATCQFITGQGELDRRENIGFRCAVSLGQLRPLP